MYAVHDSTTGENSLFEQLEAIALLPRGGPDVVAVCELFGDVVEGVGVDEIEETDGEPGEDVDSTVDTPAFDESTELDLVVAAANDDVELLVRETDDVELSFEIVDDFDEDRDEEDELDTVEEFDGKAVETFDVVKGIELLEDLEEHVDGAALADADEFKNLDEEDVVDTIDEVDELRDDDANFDVVVVVVDEL